MLLSYTVHSSKIRELFHPDCVCMVAVLTPPRL